ncbi:MAG: 16S rRNA (cytosine(1402)-N(4))-methyltransferase RsmH [Caldisericia bacterium]|nr:16S rRNA (cytosine(1402)-N(4))-methyltransferase RsmH [Caldisericia bacterium]
MKVPIHKPVLVKEILFYIDFEKKRIFLDLTIGEGGHSYEIIKRMKEDSLLIGLDIDPDVLEVAKERLKTDNRRVILINDNYKNFPLVLKGLGIEKVDFMLLDLGFSSFHLRKGRGFSFDDDISIDMRYRKNIRSGEYVINSLGEKELTYIFKTFGEIREAKRIARKIVQEREKAPITTGKRLKEIIESLYPAYMRKGSIHPATKVFQALRIYVNKELENLKTFLSSFQDYLNKNGVVEIISYHSLEDRMVKKRFLELEREGVIKVLTKRPITPQEEEIEDNIRSRSAKLRVAKKI